MKVGNEEGEEDDGQRKEAKEREGVMGRIKKRMKKNRRRSKGKSKRERRRKIIVIVTLQMIMKTR